jgi:alkylhydroperoxidase family enzyme
VSGQRIEPGGRREVGLRTAALARGAGILGGHEPMRLFLTLGRHRRLFRGWLRFAGRLMPGGILPRRETEIVILRVAHLRANEYELGHHRRLGARAGLDRLDQERIEAGPEAPGFSARERAILIAVDQLHERGDLDDEVWAELRRHLDEREAIELLLLAGHYEMLATTIQALRLQPEAPRRGLLARLRG